MVRFKIQLLLTDNTWSTRFNIPKKDNYSNSSTQGTHVSLNFNLKNYCKKTDLRSNRHGPGRHMSE